MAAAARANLSRPALVSWLGVTMYLTHDAIGAVLSELATFAPGTELVLDYMLPAGLRDDIGNSYVEQVAPAAADRGEPWLSFFAPEQVTTLLGSHGFAAIRHITQHEVGSQALWHSHRRAPAGQSVQARPCRAQRLNRLKWLADRPRPWAGTSPLPGEAGLRPGGYAWAA